VGLPCPHDRADIYDVAELDQPDGTLASEENHLGTNTASRLMNI